MRHLSILFALFLLLATEPLSAEVDTRQGCFNERFRSLQVDVEGVEMAPPIINLNAGDRIIVSFDELAEDRSYLRYSLVHCNATWQPSQLVEMEYVSGFNQADITDFRYSRGTSVHYMHYTVAIPNEDMTPLVSGNYLLQVWYESEPETILVQARFMVSEGGASVGAGVSAITDIDYNSRHQQLSIEVDADRNVVGDPFNDLIVVAQQNGRLDNQAILTHPARVVGNRAIYEHLKPLIFPAGNEYRRFETVSVTNPGMHIYEVNFYDPYYNFTLDADAPRNTEPYSYDRTQQGRYRVREYNSADSDVEADYGVVHFTLYADPMPGQHVYIDGDMVNRRFDAEAEMQYNPATSRYERSMLLKQGSYNYQYLVTPTLRGQTATSAIEGDFYPTVNEYLITVYHRTPGSRYDRLIGATRVLFNH